MAAMRWMQAMRVAHGSDWNWSKEIGKHGVRPGWYALRAWLGCVFLVCSRYVLVLSQKKSVNETGAGVELVVHPSIPNILTYHATRIYP